MPLPINHLHITHVIRVLNTRRTDHVHTTTATESENPRLASPGIEFQVHALCRLSLSLGYGTLYKCHTPCRVSLFHAGISKGGPVFFSKLQMQVQYMYRYMDLF